MIYIVNKDKTKITPVNNTLCVIKEKALWAIKCGNEILCYYSSEKEAKKDMQKQVKNILKGISSITFNGFELNNIDCLNCIMCKEDKKGNISCKLKKNFFKKCLSLTPTKEEVKNEESKEETPEIEEKDVQNKTLNNIQENEVIDNLQENKLEKTSIEITKQNKKKNKKDNKKVVEEKEPEVNESSKEEVITNEYNEEEIDLNNDSDELPQNSDYMEVEEQVQNENQLDNLNQNSEENNE